jgi:hypothetical protein
MCVLNHMNRTFALTRLFGCASWRGRIALNFLFRASSFGIEETYLHTRSDRYRVGMLVQIGCHPSPLRVLQIKCRPSALNGAERVLV